MYDTGIRVSKTLHNNFPKGTVFPRTARTPAFPEKIYPPVGRRPGARRPGPRSASCCCDLFAPRSNPELNSERLLGGLERETTEIQPTKKHQKKQRCLLRLACVFLVLVSQKKNKGPKVKKNRDFHEVAV